MTVGREVAQMASTGSQPPAGIAPRQVAPARTTRNPAGHPTPGGQVETDLGHHREAQHGHISEEELPRTGQVCVLAPVEDPVPGEKP